MSDPQIRTYLDYNATSPVLPAVLDAVSDSLKTVGNPSSVHRDGRTQRSKIDDAREQVAALAGSDPGNLVFTSGATEANAAAILGLSRSDRVKRVLCSAIEHPSVLQHVSAENRIGVSNEGIVDLDHLREHLAVDDEPALICVMYANNETGALQPVEDVCQIVHEHGSLVLCDAVQAPGRIELTAEADGVDLLTLSAHKMGGPPGTGALINYCGIEIPPMIVGGGQEKGRRSGTENSAGIIGFGVAAEYVKENDISNALKNLRDKFEAALIEVRPDCHIISDDVDRLPNTTCISLPGASSEQQIINLDLAGFSVSAGSACSSGKMAQSHVLQAMGLDDEIVKSAIRVSIGYTTDWDDLARFVDCWASI